MTMLLSSCMQQLTVCDAGAALAWHADYVATGHIPSDNCFAFPVRGTILVRDEFRYLSRTAWLAPASQEKARLLLSWVESGYLYAVPNSLLSQRRRTMVHACWKSWVFSRRLKVLSDSSGRVAKEVDCSRLRGRTRRSSAGQWKSELWIWFQSLQSVVDAWCDVVTLPRDGYQTSSRVAMPCRPSPNCSSQQNDFFSTVSKPTLHTSYLPDQTHTAPFPNLPPQHDND